MCIISCGLVQSTFDCQSHGAIRFDFAKLLHSPPCCPSGAQPIADNYFVAALRAMKVAKF
jgi:hypothetical protein